jgi:hypothetical protein
MLTTTESPALGEERVPPEEAHAIALITQVSLTLLDTQARPVQRGQHPKTHGCVRAEFTVESSLPAELRHGLFATPRSFPALVRFSNSLQKNDEQPGVHGMAVKLLGVEGKKVLPTDPDATTHDFVLMDVPVFFIRDAASYAKFSQAIFATAHPSMPEKLGGLIQLVQLMVGYFRGRSGERKAFLRAAFAKSRSPLLSQYWSATPYRLGPHAIRFTFRPDPATAGPVPPKRGRDRLREAMRAHLAAGEARFDMLVQLQTDPVAMPVEDPTVPWDEAISPWRKVATLRIPSQSFESPAQLEMGENLSFTPWHALPEHRPLGGINRVRRAVYEVLSTRRHELNRVPQREPDGAD